jgi:hypothetical protein
MVQLDGNPEQPRWWQQQCQAPLHVTISLLLFAAAVTGLSMCVRQPLIATCSMDRTVHLWNYSERTCELTKSFAEEAYSIAIHPTGLQVNSQQERNNRGRQLMCSLQKTL